MVVSNEGFAHWAKPSTAALKSGRYIRTRETIFELPLQAFAARRDYSDAAVTGVTQQAGVRFPEPVHEMCFRSERYDQEITLLCSRRMVRASKRKRRRRTSSTISCGTGRCRSPPGSAARRLAKYLSSRLAATDLRTDHRLSLSLTS